MARATGSPPISLDEPLAERADAELIVAAQAGDDTALDALVRRFEPRVYRYALRMCRDPEVAADVLQETLLALARNLGGFRGDAALGTWLFAIARRQCMRRGRRRRGEPLTLETLDGVSTQPAVNADPAAAMEARELRQRLEAAIADLEPMYREALVLRDIEGLPAAEVAAATGLTIAAVKSRLHRARARLRDAMAPVLSGEPTPAHAGCPDVVRLFSEYLEGDIPPDLCARMEAHIDTCPRCARLCDSLKQTLKICGAVPSAVVPSDIQEAVRAGFRQALKRRT